MKIRILLPLLLLFSGLSLFAQIAVKLEAPYPVYGSVGPNSAVSGVPSAAAMCIGPLSLQSSRRERRIASTGLQLFCAVLRRRR